MRTLFLIACGIAISMPLTARAQEAAPAQRPEIIIGGGKPQSVLRHESCVEVEIGGDKAYNCLNEKLRAEVQRTAPVANIPPVDARSSDLKLGLVNVPAVQQQYGKNFGVSVVPFRPALPVYGNSIGR